MPLTLGTFSHLKKIVDESVLHKPSCYNISDEDAVDFHKKGATSPWMNDR